MGRGIIMLVLVSVLVTVSVLVSPSVPWVRSGFHWYRVRLS
jgi:hypothetical protein